MIDTDENKAHEFRFDVALTFPDEHRRFVRSVAKHLATELGRERVFYDEWYEAELAGKNGDLKLQRIYRDESSLVVPFFSKYYKKTWCKIEWDAVRAMLIERRRDDAVMPVKMDDTEIDGWQSIDFHVTRNRRTAEEIASLILQKLDHEDLDLVKPSSSRGTRILATTFVIVIFAIAAFTIFVYWKNVPTNLINPVRISSAGIELREVPAGSFQMGSAVGHADESPPHRVTLVAYELGVYEVSRRQFSVVMTGDNGDARRSELPITAVSWFEAVRFCNALSELEGLPKYYEILETDVAVSNEGANGYRLPTEAEWEYACRAGSQPSYSFGNGREDLHDYAWFDYGTTPHPVGKKLPNDWGFHDMHGNVFEWCWDWYKDDYYRSSPRENPTGPVSGIRRVTRGGSIHTDGEERRAWYCRSSHRSAFTPDEQFPNLGFRVARTLVPLNDN